MSMQNGFSALILFGCLLTGCAAEPANESNPAPAAADIASIPASQFVLDNGLEVILVENRANPMITAFTVVRVGSRDEDAGSSGSAHFLEHLLFNGTTNRTQKQLYDEMDFYGGYNNASTGPDYTSYMILMPREYIAQGMEIQADMLFNSTLPAGKFEKERGIVIEEIGQRADHPDAQAEVHWRRRFFGGTPYVRPVLGTSSSIANLKRERVLGFYKRWYIPNNMTLMVVGDFETANMLSLIEEKYGNAPAQPIQQRQLINLAESQDERMAVANGRGVFPQNRQFLTMGYTLPAPGDGSLAAQQLFHDLLGGGASARLQSHFRRPEMAGKVHRIYSQHSFNSDFSRLHIHADLDISADPEQIAAEVQTVLKAMQESPPARRDLNRARRSRRSNDIFLAEKLHYYGVEKAAYLAAGGFALLQHYDADLQQVRVTDLQSMATQLARSKPAISLLRPPVSGGQAKAASSAETAGPQLLRRQLENGMQVVIHRHTQTRATGMHLLIHNRHAHEPTNMRGLTEVLQRSLLYGGTQKNPGNAWQDGIAELGSELKLFDNPDIPYDDYYQSPRFAYIRLKVVSESLQKAIAELADIAQNAELDQASFAKAQQEVRAIAERKASSAPARAEKLLYDQLLARNPGFGLTEGDTATNARMTLASLQTLYQALYHPSNLSLVVSGNLPAKEVLAQIEAAFAGSIGRAADTPERQALRLRDTWQPVEENLGKAQSYLYVADRFLIQESDAPALGVLMSLFSGRLAFNLREKQGLAYRISARAERFGEEYAYIIKMGTRPENLQRAKAGILREIAAMRTLSLRQDEVQRTVNALIGRRSMRRLDRVGQAYFMSMALLRGDAPERDFSWRDDMLAARPDSLARLAKTVFSGQSPLTVIVR